MCASVLAFFRERRDAGPPPLALFCRAIAYAIGKGVTVIGGSGNDNIDLDHPTTDDSSPDNGTPRLRNVTLDCPQVRIVARWQPLDSLK